LINGQISGLVNWAINEPINKTNDKLIEKSDGTALKGTGEECYNFDKAVMIIFLKDVSDKPKDNRNDVDNNADTNFEKIRDGKDTRPQQDIERNVFLDARIIGQVSQHIFCFRTKMT